MLFEFGTVFSTWIWDINVLDHSATKAVYGSKRVIKNTLLYVKTAWSHLKINSNGKIVVGKIRKLQWLYFVFKYMRQKGGCLKRRHVHVAEWPRGRSAEIIYKYNKYNKSIFLMNLNFHIFYY